MHPLTLYSQLKPAKTDLGFWLPEAVGVTNSYGMLYADTHCEKHLGRAAAIPPDSWRLRDTGVT